MGKKKKGFPVAILIGLEEKRAYLWEAFSRKFQSLGIVKLAGSRKDNQSEYKFHENIINMLRPLIKEGLTSLVIIIPPKSDFSEKFQKHIQKHHQWLVNSKSIHAISIGQLEGTISDLESLQILAMTEKYREILNLTSEDEGDKIIALLTKRFNKDQTGENFLYIQSDIQNLLEDKQRLAQITPEYLLFTEEKYQKVFNTREGQRLIQLAKNVKFKVRILENESITSDKVEEFGGIICLINSKSSDN